MESQTVTVPEVGMGVTMSVGSDRYPYTIVGVSNQGKTIQVQQDNARRTDSNGLSEIQCWEFTPNTNANVVTLTQHKNGRYIRQGEPLKSATRWYIGRRDRYDDPSF